MPVEIGNLLLFAIAWWGVVRHSWLHRLRLYSPTPHVEPRRWSFTSMTLYSVVALRQPRSSCHWQTRFAVPSACVRHDVEELDSSAAPAPSR